MIVLIFKSILRIGRNQKEAPPDMKCKDMLRIQSIVARPGVTTKDITSEMVTTNTKLFLYIVLKNIAVCVT